MNPIYWILAPIIIALPLVAAGKDVTDKEVTVGYQLNYSPWEVAIKNGTFERATGYKMSWRRLDSGAKVISAMVLGDVQIALLGSAPIAAAVSRGIDIQLFWIIADISHTEALVARDGAGIVTLQDLKGKNVAVPFFSTSHFHLAFALEQFGIDPGEVNLINLQPYQIASAWRRGDIDAAYVWYPVLAYIKNTGKVLVTSAQLSALGKSIFDGLVVERKFAETHPDFMVKFVKTMAEADEAYRSNAEAWTLDSPMVQTIVQMVGGDPETVPEVLGLYRFPILEEQASCTWLGCGDDGGAARSLRATAEFLKDQGQIDIVLPDYGRYVTPKYVEAVLDMQ